MAVDEKKYTMEELLAHASTFRGLKKFDHVDAVFISSDRRQALFDIGGKSEAIVIDEHFKEAKELIKSLKKGDKVESVVMDPENKDGRTVLSLRHAAHAKLWNSLRAIFDKNERINVTGQLATDKGIAVSVYGLNAFIPTTQLSSEHSKDVDSLVGKSFEVQIIELDSTRNRIVLSEKAIVEQADLNRVKEILKKLKKDHVHKGVVTTVTSFGAFVEIEVSGEKVEGLVHVSEFSWGKTVHPSDLLSEGDEVEVVVLSTEGGKLALSMKQAQKDPWEAISETYKVDDKVEGVVVKHSDFGVFVELTPGVEGLIHMTKIPPATKLNKGEKVMCYIEEINAEERRISLGLVMTTSKPIGYK